MRTIHVKRVLHASPERVFDLLADHAGYLSFPGVKSAKVVRPGPIEANGVGALREIDTGLAWFQEEITAFERPTRLEYRIVRSRPPIAHELGRLTFSPVSEGVEVSWTSTFRVTIPVIGGLVTAFAARQMSHMFASALRIVEQRARTAQAFDDQDGARTLAK